MEKLSKEPYDKKYLNFFRELISTQSSVRQEELEKTLLQHDNEVEYAIQNTFDKFLKLSSTHQKLAFN